MTDNAKIPPSPPGQRPPLSDDDSTDAIPRPANELDGDPIEEEPDDDPQKAG